MRVSKMIKRVNHVAVAVRDTEEALRFYKEVLGLQPSESKAAPEQGLKITFLPIGDGEIEFLEPISETSTVAKFLEKRGEGLHHICLEVDDIEATLHSLSERGVPLVDTIPRVGAHGTRIAFIHPEAAHGILIELSETK
ncbi:MAG: methylmalonyl-CoA epimerase [Chloroflexi bacterium]|nr:methylmalonyl-CoA epimerase [Chloroflexota bacterium]MCL5074788.1 methylmalonyl-CoA epimerase [Chloroflexota bacterium]